MTEEIFALAQEQPERNKRHSPRRTLEPTLLQGMLACKRCGYAFYRTSTRTSKRKLYYYRCLGSDDYRYQNGRLCENRPVRQDHLDEVVWRAVMELLKKPELIRAEMDRRIEVARESAPTKRREAALRKGRARVEKQTGRLLDACQEERLPLEELRRRMLELRKRQQAVQSELLTLDATDADKQMCLPTAETIEGFLSRVRAAADSMNVEDRQKILRLMVEEILVDDDAITIRHSIPVQDPGAPPTSPGGPKIPGYLLRSGSFINTTMENHESLSPSR